jgi:ribosomal protein L37AE/L43A
MDGKVLHEKVKSIWDTTWKKNIVVAADNDFMDVTLPPSYSNFPEVNTAPKGHTVMTLDCIVEYFEQLADSRVKDINGKSTSSDTTYVCDYCGISRMTHGSSYWYCNECNMDMCTLCKEEDSHEKAEANGAKRWHERKHALEACRKHGLFERKVIASGEWVCNVCNDPLKGGEWFENREDDFDVCLHCSETDEGRTEIIEREMTKHVVEHPAADAMFGSLLDWIPLIRSGDGNMVLQNLNPASPWHLKFALTAVDDHGRCGYFTLWKPDSLTLTEIFQEIGANIKRKIVKEGDSGSPKKPKVEGETEGSKDNDGSTTEFDDDGTIKKMMRKRHMKTHYG